MRAPSAGHTNSPTVGSARHCHQRDYLCYPRKIDAAQNQGRTIFSLLDAQPTLWELEPFFLPFTVESNMERVAGKLRTKRLFETFCRG
jgi:hypothetical protein